MFDDARMFARFAVGLRRFLNRPLRPEECGQIVRDGLRNRERSFLLVLRRAVFDNPASPYLALFRRAGALYGDVARLVEQRGLESALEAVHDEGVYLTLEEFKGRKPIRRSGLELKVRAEDFDNPLLVRHFEVQTGGSGSVGRRLGIDFETLVHDTACIFVFHRAIGVHELPGAVWRPVPPGSSGLRNALVQSKMARGLERWFTPNQPNWRGEEWKSVVFTRYAVAASRFTPNPLPNPVYTPLDRAVDIARWLGAHTASGSPARLDGPVSSGMRVLIAAKEEGIDISGNWFRFGGEPYTEAKARLVEEAGCRARCSWTLSELGRTAVGCARPEVVDEVHLLASKAALTQRPKTLDGEEVRALYLTSLLPSAPKLMINVETGDCGVLSERRCGCELEALGLDRRLHTIRSYEKLTTAGMHFLGMDLITLVEEVLPARFGGYPTDYQFVDDVRGPLSRVTLVVSPSVGKVDEGQVVSFVLDQLGKRSRSDRMMADHWRGGGTLRVERRRPYTTPAAKTPALKVMRT